MENRPVPFLWKTVENRPVPLQELRTLVRAAIARHTGEPAAAGPTMGSRASIAEVSSGWRGHASHGVYALVNTSEACVIEPSVPCNHCHYCMSHGH